MSEETTHRADAWRESEPAELPPDAGVVADHVAQVVVEPIHAYNHTSAFSHYISKLFTAFSSLFF